MIEGHHFRETLGLTQEEAAMLLKIGISQLAMYEVGQRELPTIPRTKLLTMYDYVQNKLQQKSVHPDLKAEHAETTEMLEKELKENQFQQLALERKLNNLKSKYQKNRATLQLAEYLETQVPNQDANEKELAEMFRIKAIKGIEKNGLLVQTKLNVKLNTLQWHQKELLKELEKYKIDSNS